MPPGNRGSAGRQYPNPTRSNSVGQSLITNLFITGTSVQQNQQQHKTKKSHSVDSGIEDHDSERTFIPLQSFAHTASEILLCFSARSFPYLGTTFRPARLTRPLRTSPMSERRHSPCHAS